MTINTGLVHKSDGICVCGFPGSQMLADKMNFFCFCFCFVEYSVRYAASLTEYARISGHVSSHEGSPLPVCLIGYRVYPVHSVKVSESSDCSEKSICLVGDCLFKIKAFANYNSS